MTIDRQITGILGTKLGMTQVFDENNRIVPVTVVQAGPNVVTQVRTATTGHGPASITVTGVTWPDSASNSWVMPSLVPMMPLPIARP